MIAISSLLPRANLELRPAAVPPPARPFEQALVDAPPLAAASGPGAKLTPGLKAPLPKTMATGDLIGGQPLPADAAFDNATPVPSDRMFGFDELGMFGQFAARFSQADAAASPAAAMPSPVDTSSAAGAVPAASAAPGSGRAWPSPLSPGLPRAPALPAQAFVANDSSTFEDESTASPLGAQSPAIDLQQAVQPETVFTQSVFENAPVGFAAAESGGESALVGTGGKLPSRAQPPANGARPVDLVVAGQDAALSVIARSAGDSAADYGRLRRLLEDAAAEFGVGIADFHLSGASPEPSFTTLLGGTRGGRTR